MFDLLEDRCVPAITGIVFEDYNANGIYDTNPATGPVDVGVAGITVTAYDAGNTEVANAVSDALGNYVLNVSGTGPYRVEFTSLPTGVYFGPTGTSNGSAVQYVNSSDAANVDLGVVRPEDFTSSNPTLVTNEYVVGGTTAGDLNPGTPVIVSYPDSAGAPESDPTQADHLDPTTHDLSVTQQTVGATWGLTYDASTNQIYAAAYMKRTTGFGPAGPGAIYQMNTTGTSATVFADLNAIFPDDPAGNLNDLYTDSNGNPVSYRTDLTNYDWFTDGLSQFTTSDGVVTDLGWDSVGKIALGGLASSADGSTLYTVALGDRMLYSLPTSGPLNAKTVERFELPVPSDVTGITAANPLGDLRPFAVTVYRGIVYIGAVNSAESTQNAADLKAYVFAFDPSIGQFINLDRQPTTTQPVFEFALNYPRGYVQQGQDIDPNEPTGLTPPDPAAWNPWSPVFQSVEQQPYAQGRSDYPQPMFTGLSFDSSGNIVIGLRDRSGDEVGRAVPSDPNDPNNYSLFSMTAGDTLEAFINAPDNLDAVQANPSTLFSGWTLESNARSPDGTLGVGPQNNGQGPGGGSFYYQQDFPHDPLAEPDGFTGAENEYVSDGGVLALPGTTQTLVTSFNPVRQPGDINSGGVRWYDSDTGSLTQSYDLYITPAASSNSTFAKGNGVGDVVAVPGQAPIEIGNYVWFDTNGDGIQEAGEPGEAGVSVDLYSGSTLLATAVTDANGDYSFSSAAGTSSASKIYGLALTPDSPYEILVDPTQAALSGLTFTTQFADSSANGTQRDSNANASGMVTVVTPMLGVTDDSFDIGLIKQQVIVVPPPPPPPILLPATIAGVVFRDNCPVNGIYQPANGETGIDGVVITLTGTTADGPVKETTVTNASGDYSFVNLEPGSYTITETQPLGFYQGIDTLGNLGGTAPKQDVFDVTLAVADNGTGYDFSEVPSTGVYGYVFNDVDNSHSFDAGDIGIPNVQITISGTAFDGTSLARPLTAADSLGGLTIYTDSTGRWQFPELPPGEYKVVESEPSGYASYFATVQESMPGVAVTVGTNSFSALSLCSGETRGEFNFGAIAPIAPTLVSKRELLGSAGTTVTVPPSSTGALSTVPPTTLPLNPPFTVSTGTPTVPAFVVVAAGAGAAPLVKVYDYSTGVEKFQFYAYEQSFEGGVRVAVADVNGDGVPDIITAAGPGGGPRIRVFSGVDGSVIDDFFAYESSFRGGSFVAAGDVNGDGRADIVTGADLGGGPRVTVFDGVTHARIEDFFAFPSSERGGVRVAVADFNGDGHADIVATAGPGVTTEVRIFNGATLGMLADYEPYTAAFTGGVYIAAGDVNGDGVPDVVTGADAGGGPDVQVYSGLTSKPLYGFFADDASFRGGVRVAVQDVEGDGKDDIITGTGPGAQSTVSVWHDGATTPIEQFAFEENYSGGVYVG